MAVRVRPASALVLVAAWEPGLEPASESGSEAESRRPRIRTRHRLRHCRPARRCHPTGTHTQRWRRRRKRSCCHMPNRRGPARSRGFQLSSSSSSCNTRGRTAAIAMFCRGSVADPQQVFLRDTSRAVSFKRKPARRITTRVVWSLQNRPQRLTARRARWAFGRDAISVRRRLRLVRVAMTLFASGARC